WPSANIPGPGHYCFLATAGNEVEPAPSPDTFNTFNDFIDYIYAHNNITWRDFNVVAMGQHQRGGGFHEFIPLRFLVSGGWDGRHAFAFETLAGLPPGSRLALQVPHWLGHGLRPAHSNLEEHEDADTDPDDRRRVRIPLHAQGPQRLGEIELRARTAAASHLLVHVPEKHRDRPWQGASRQL